MQTRIGVFVPNWVGDVVMATPALRALRVKFGSEAELIGIMRPYVGDVLAGTSWLNRTITYDRKRISSMVHLSRNLRALSLDMVVLLTNSFSTALLAWAGRTKRRIGHAMYHRRWLLTDWPDSISRQDEPRSAVDRYLDVVQILGCPIDDKQLELATSAADRTTVAAMWHRFGWHERQPVVVFNTGGAYGAAKVWPPEHFRELAKQLIAQRDVCVLFLCGPAERSTVRDICRQIGDPRVRSVADQTLGIGLSKACVQRACAMVTTDSGPRHFAAAFKVPTVTLFGPTDPRWSANYHDVSINLQLDMNCVPCSRRVCPHGHHRCMRDLTVAQVLSATLSLLDRATVKHVA